VASCLPSSATVARKEPVLDEPALERRAVVEFARIEEAALRWLAAADPRLARRAGTTGSDDVLDRIGTEAVLAEDVTAQIHGGSLDLFAFRARARALAHAAELIAAFPAPLPERGSVEGSLARPRLERELLLRLIAQERARTDDEAELGNASGDLVRGILSTWTPPAAAQDWVDRDAWLAKHLLEVRDALRAPHEASGPLDVDVALYPLERLLAPPQFPRAVAAIAEVRVALDATSRGVPPLATPDHIARAVRTYLGVAVDAGRLQAQLEDLETRLRSISERLASGPNGRALLARARELLLVEGTCPPVPGSPVRSMAPPPERTGICGILRALTDDGLRDAATIALHDDLIFAIAGLTTAPPPRTRLISAPEDDVVDALERSARERPVPALGVALAATIAYAKGDDQARLRAWGAFGEAPLDVVTHELADC
jgi:hypothetical protein